MAVEIGDRVSFVARGKRHEGVVTGSHYKAFRGRRKELRKAFGGEAGVAMHVIKVGEVMWKVPVGSSSLKVVEKAAVEASAARGEGYALKSKILASRRVVARARISRNIDAIRGNALESLKIGDAIEVELKDSYSKRTSWYAAEFRGFVAGSGNVKYSRFGHERSTSAAYVRIPKKGE